MMKPLLILLCLFLQGSASASAQQGRQKVAISQEKGCRTVYVQDGATSGSVSIGCIDASGTYRSADTVDPHMFGAVGDCVADDTQAYRDAIAQARKTKRAIGGEGCFRITGSLDNSGVTIRGPIAPYTRNSDIPATWGHVLAHDSNQESLFAPSGSGWILEDVVLYDPRQTGTGLTPVVRPPMIKILKESADWTIKGSVVVNAFDFFSTGPSSVIGDGRITDNRIYAVHIVYDLHGIAPETIFERGNIYSPGVYQRAAVFANKAMLAAWTAKNGTIRLIDVKNRPDGGPGSIDGWAPSDNFNFGYARAIDIVRGLYNVGTMSNERYDQIAQIVRTHGDGGIILSMSGGNGYILTSRDLGQALPAFDFGGQGTHMISITGFHGIFAAGSWCDIHTDARVILSITGGILDIYGRNDGSRKNMPACRIDGAAARINFRPGYVQGGTPTSIGLQVVNALNVLSDTTYDNIFLPIDVKASTSQSAKIFDRSVTLRTIGPRSYQSLASPGVLTAAGTYDKPFADTP
ncbi:hypothetical protein [Sphingobium sp. DN12]|uniref:hypothetical protein n=1 Tax=Sphingobium sp. DN12 TaxID=3378073 RepID=UPI003DA38555